MLLTGGEFARQDMEDDRRVVVVDDRLAERAFPGGNAVGRCVQTQSPWVTVPARSGAWFSATRCPWCFPPP